MQEEDFSHADLYRRACRLHERKLRHAVEVALGGGDRRGRGAGRRRGPVRGVHRRDPLRARDRVPRQRAGEARGDPDRSGDDAGPVGGAAARRRRAPAGRDPRRRHRLDARCHAHDRGDPPARRARLRDRGRRHRPGGRPAPVGGGGDRRAVLPGPADRRAEPAGRGADARGSDGGGGYDAIHVCSPGPAGIAGALVARALGLPLSAATTPS